MKEPATIIAENSRIVARLAAAARWPRYPVVSLEERRRLARLSAAARFAARNADAPPVNVRHRPSPQVRG